MEEYRTEDDLIEEYGDPWYMADEFERELIDAENELFSCLEGKEGLSYLIDILTGCEKPDSELFEWVVRSEVESERIWFCPIDKRIAAESGDLEISESADEISYPDEEGNPIRVPVDRRLLERGIRDMAEEARKTAISDRCYSEYEKQMYYSER